MTCCSQLKFFRCILPILFWIFAGSAGAHPPYYTQIEELLDTDNRRVELKLLHGDGIFFADPIRAVVVDGDGRLLAMSPMSLTLFIWCREAGGRRDCLVYDHIGSSLYEPDPASWKAILALEEAGSPQNYPELWTSEEEYGFKFKKASLLEILKYEALSTIDSPASTLLAILLWICVWSLIIPPLRRLRQSRWRIRNVSWTSVLLEIVRFMVIAILILCTAYGWLLFPYSLYYLLFVTSLGAGLVVFAPKVWAKRPWASH